MSRALKNALKMAVAAVLAMLAHDLMHAVARQLPEFVSFADPSRKAWSVLTACLVMQSNLGGSLRDAGSRLVGTGVGALIGALAAVALLPFKGGLHWVLAVAAVGLSVGLTSLICTAVGLKTSLRLACMTLALVLVTFLDPSRPDDPWVLGRERFVDVAIGIGVALLTQLLVFPQPAERELRQSLAKLLNGCADLLQSAMDAYLRGAGPAPERADLRARVRAERQQNLALLLDLASEPGLLRPQRRRLVGLAADAGDLAENLIALDDSAQALRRDEFLTHLDRLGPELLALSGAVQSGVEWLIREVSQTRKGEPPPDLDSAIKAIDARFLRLSEQGLLRHYSPSELLRFCSFLFNLRAVGREVAKMLATAAPERPAAAEPAEEPTRTRLPERQLLEAFRKTDYRVEGPSGTFRIRLEQVCAELDEVLTARRALSWAYVTAHNPNAARLSDAQNARRKADLERDVSAMGLTFFRGEAVAEDGSWPPEPSLLVLGVAREAAVALARKYGQLAILYGEAGQPAQLLWV
jgi:uncharacterized membrane protein YgaE (UPF0421/DUF939 family)